ncbi:MAG: 6,7-dimethyl-8-ribityllumazine synthase [SAR202 cluster bacterium]|nr:6,7-dimethyl-8-ribityllumazine synthase [SAR202 cluster bacterium]
MARELKGTLDAQDLHVGIIVSQFNEFVTSKLLAGARDALRRHGVREERVTVVWVPGALELPQVAQRMADSGKWDALIALGCVIRGETSHYDVVANESARGIAEVARATGVPVTFGVLTTNDADQAAARAGGKLGNRGYDAAESAIKMASLYRQLAVEPTPVS